MTSLLYTLARLYFSHFPVEWGKWRLWTMFRPRLGDDCFSEGEYNTKYGMRMRLTPSYNINKFIYFWGCWEPNETRVVSRILRPGDTFVDIGANEGYFTLLASKIVGNHGKVISFEPVPPTIKVLKTNVRLNRAENIRIYECAVANKPGVVKIGKFLGTGPRSGQNTMRIKENMCEFWEVPSIKLDEILASEHSIRLVKIDIEGAELLALKGFEKYLEKNNAPCILCEITDSYMKELGGSSAELYHFMTRLGYHAYSCLNLEPIDFNTITKLYQINVLFSKEQVI